MSPESFDRSKTDLQSLLRSGTWLYTYTHGQGAIAPLPNTPDRSSSPFNMSDLNNDSRSIDEINLRNVDSEDLLYQTFNFDPLEDSSDRFSDRFPEAQNLGRNLGRPLRMNLHWASAKRLLLAPFQGKRPWGWLLLALGALIPVSLVQGVSQMPLPQSAASLSNPVIDPFERATQQADWAILLSATAQTPADWQAIVRGWQNALNTLQRIPPSDSQYAMAQNRIVSYRGQLDYATAQLQSSERASQSLTDQDAVFRGAVRAATQASELTQTAHTRQEWQNVAKNWQVAIDGMNQITVQSPHYVTAQDRISLYTQNLNYAQNNAQK